MNVTWVDVQDDGERAEWRGLLVTRLESAARPPFHIEAGRGNRLRVHVGGRPVLWARVAADYYGYAYVRARDAWRSVVPPISFEEVRTVQASGSVEAIMRAWAKWVVKSLAQTGDVLASAQTFVGPCTSFLGAPRFSWTGERIHIPTAGWLESMRECPDAAYVDWTEELAPLPMRALSRANDGRVKAFRKLARDAVLPPVLLAWCNGLQRYLVADGHDRLLAALLEGVAPPCVAVSSLLPARVGDRTRARAALEEAVANALDGSQERRRPTITVDHANRLLVRAYDDPPMFATLAWPLADGVASWDAEIAMAGVSDADVLSVLRDG